MLLVPSLCNDPPLPDWESPEEFLKEVNEYRAKFAKERKIPNMYKLTWNETLLEVLNGLNVDFGHVEFKTIQFLAANDSSWDGVGKNWRVTELQTFSAAVAVIDEDVHVEHVLKTLEVRRSLIRGNKENISQTEFIHPLQTSIGCMKKERINYDNEREHVTSCLLGNLGQWPSNWKIDVNSKKIPGSECMDGYVNDDGLCVLAPPTTTTSAPTTLEATTTPKTTEKTTPKEAETVPATPMKPEASDEKNEKEGASVEENAELEPGQEALESSTRIYSYGPWILVFICLIF
ncbi:hypothetical protein CAEBREN_08663 [Caenorhabditis brenneri]|uniref:Uncharacterized protein n=1 Tax=Caenorhabditis brenneri TaxID=135651 RepID=G0MVU7_CAEBE|nr:hypothetical protein CAEBREN_08663 [Caenorhabditis brenneri]